MRALLDTTYLFPVIGIGVRQANPKTVDDLLDAGHEILVSEISIFELSAKGARYVSQGKLTAESVAKGINSILHDDTIKKLSFHDTSILRLSFALRGLHGDYIDCLILSSALREAAVLVTEDGPIHELKKQEAFEELMTATHSNCKILTLNQFMHL